MTPHRELAGKLADELCPCRKRNEARDAIEAAITKAVHDALERAAKRADESAEVQQMHHDFYEGDDCVHEYCRDQIRDVASSIRSLKETQP